VILFHSLEREHIKRIVDIQLRHLQKLLADRRITIELSENAKEYLAEIGYDPIFGARPLKRVIQREIQDSLALAILEGRIREGEHITVDADEEGVIFDAVVEGDIL
jgi:ATP-dependent Clp protease ATP-binding subunit ClpB